MTFDASQYEREVLRPLRGTYGPLPTDHVGTLFSLTGELTDDEITRRLDDVRAFWTRRSQGADSIASICADLIGLDAQLRTENGAAHDDPAWWRRHITAPATAGRARPAPSPRPRPGDPTRPRQPVDSQSPDQRSGTGGSLRPDQRRSTAVIRGLRDSVRAQPSRTPQASPPRQARRAAEPAGPDRGTPVARINLVAEPLSATGQTVRIRLTWLEPAAGTVVLRHGSINPTWATDDLVPVAQLEAFGWPVTGTPTVDKGRCSIEVDVPTGFQAFAAFVVQDGQGRVEPAFSQVVAPSIDQLNCRRVGADVIVTWEWRAKATLAVVTATTPSRVSAHRVTFEEYRLHGGWRVPVLDEGATISVQTIQVMPDQSEAMSQPVTTSLRGRPVNLRWKPVRRIGRRGAHSVELETDQERDGVTVLMVARSGAVMPTRAEDGVLCVRSDDLTFEAGVPHRIDFEVPPSVSRPFWLRCFAEPAEAMSVIDPSVESMRVGR